MTLLAVIAALLVAGIVPPPRRRRRPAVEPVDAVTVGRLVVLALGAGLSVHGALAVAADEVPGATRRALRSVLHGARHVGLAGMLPDAPAELRPLLSVLARAMAVGSPVITELSSHLREVDRERRAGALASARSLPVRLTLPLTLLILPGCVLLLVGPALLDAVASLPGGGFIP